MARVRYFLKDRAQALFVAAPGRGGEAQQVPRRTGGQEAEVFKEPLIGGRHGVVRLIDDDEEKLFRLQPAESGSSRPAERPDLGHYHFGAGWRPAKGILNTE